MEGSDISKHGNTSLLDLSSLVCTRDDLAKLEDFLIKTDVIESCSQKRMNTNWRFYRLTNLTLFPVLLKDVPIACKDAILPEPLLKNHTKKCLTYEEKTCQPYKRNLCFFVRLLSFCTEIDIWKKIHVKLSTC